MRVFQKQFNDDLEELFVQFGREKLVEVMIYFNFHSLKSDRNFFYFSSAIPLILDLTWHSIIYLTVCRVSLRKLILKSRDKSRTSLADLIFLFLVFRCKPSALPSRRQFSCYSDEYFRLLLFAALLRPHHNFQENYHRIDEERIHWKRIPLFWTILAWRYIGRFFS